VGFQIDEKESIKQLNKERSTITAEMMLAIKENEIKSATINQFQL